MNKLFYLGLLLIASPLVMADCFDYDNGINPYQYGFAISEGIKLNDYCFKELGTVMENYCFEDKIKLEMYICPLGCGNIFVYNISLIYSDLNWILDNELGYCYGTSNYLDVLGYSFGQTQEQEENQTEEPINETPEEPINETEYECYFNEDCQEGYECVENTCQEIEQEPEYECIEDSDCEQGYECVGGTCQEIITPHEPECQTNEDCELNYICIEGICVYQEPEQEPECVQNWDCPTSKFCIDEICQFIPCESDSDCTDNQFCAGNHCQYVVCENGYVSNHQCIHYGQGCYSHCVFDVCQGDYGWCLAWCWDICY